MKHPYSCVAIALLLAGCGGSGGDSDTNNETSIPTYTIAGSVTVAGADTDTSVCVDINENYLCDSNEPSTNANNSGEFSLTSTDRTIYSKPLIATHANVHYLAPARTLETGNVINGVTTLIAAQMVAGQTLEQAAQVVQQQLSDAGLNLSGSLLDNLTAAELTTLETHLTEAFALISDSQDLQVERLLTYNLNDAVNLTSEPVITEAQMSQLVASLKQLAGTATALNDTGVTLYFSDDSSDVSAAPADYPGQDADYGFDKTDVQTTTGKGFQFVKLDAAGNELADDAAQWSCVLDQRSGLIWENKLDDAQSVRHKERLFALELADRFKPHATDIAQAGCTAAGDNICTTKDYVDYVNTQTLCGVSNWRLPTDGEIFNLIDFGETATDANDNLYGFSVKYFPNQGFGPDYGYGAVWSDNVAFSQYAAYAEEHTMYYPYITTRTADYRGSRSFITVQDESYDTDSASYQLPVRLTATKGE
ncbi:DUF1566 domain-containing protein [Shewanella sp. C32]|uniref:DUF1566 domain-containing protein n=1 Tax=Shewanella electrica TaxID=515560 RepID=A0ABT2FID0_9GAMM|nr:DUF1566 domain-containing protein [Shewanella electrica]MCH1924189.1 DUF1566 domain-containing protein [Shewanella electrica]MCS4556092.1 DUF1566 domain-containing protein [Shewanella electrica]